MKDIFGQAWAVLLAGLVGAGMFAWGMARKGLEPFRDSVTLTISLGFATGCLAGVFLSLYDKIQTWKKSDDRHRWRVRHARLVEFGWWVLLFVGTIAIIGAATLMFS